MKPKPPAMAFLDLLSVERARSISPLFDQFGPEKMMVRHHHWLELMGRMTEMVTESTQAILRRQTEILASGANQLSELMMASARFDRPADALAQQLDAARRVLDAQMEGSRAIGDIARHCVYDVMAEVARYAETGIPMVNGNAEAIQPKRAVSKPVPAAPAAPTAPPAKASAPPAAKAPAAKAPAAKAPAAKAPAAKAPPAKAANPPSAAAAKEATAAPAVEAPAVEPVAAKTATDVAATVADTAAPTPAIPTAAVPPPATVPPPAAPTPATVPTPAATPKAAATPPVAKKPAAPRTPRAAKDGAATTGQPAPRRRPRAG